MNQDDPKTQQERLDHRLGSRLQPEEYFREEMLAAARERNLDRLNKALTDSIAVNLKHKGDIEDAKQELMALCQEEIEKAVKRNKLEELRECIKKIDDTCVGKEAQEQAWFKKGKEVLWKLEVGQEAMAQCLRNKDEADLGKPPDHVIDVIVAAFILLGEREKELDTWQKVTAKLKETNKEQLINKVNSLECSLLTRERADLAREKLGRAGGTVGDCRSL